jgi:CheY-like chemotaxis protein
MRTILVIEDNPEIRENTAEILELAGFRVLSAENGNEGVRVAAEARPDLILCDIMMPGLNGYDVLRQLKSNAVTASIPFVYVTASGEKNEVKMAMDLGANGYVRKPFDVKELMQVIDQYLEHRP